MIRWCFAALSALSASSGQTQTAAPADISFHATLDARSVKVSGRGDARIQAWAQPDGGSVAQSSGNRSSRHFELRIDARIADLLGGRRQTGTIGETASPEPR